MVQTKKEEQRTKKPPPFFVGGRALLDAKQAGGASSARQPFAKQRATLTRQENSKQRGKEEVPPFLEPAVGQSLAGRCGKTPSLQPSKARHQEGSASAAARVPKLALHQLDSASLEPDTTRTPLPGLPSVATTAREARSTRGKSRTSFMPLSARSLPGTHHPSGTSAWHTTPLNITKIGGQTTPRQPADIVTTKAQAPLARAKNPKQEKPAVQNTIHQGGKDRGEPARPHDVGTSAQYPAEKMTMAKTQKLSGAEDAADEREERQKEGSDGRDASFQRTVKEQAADLGSAQFQAEDYLAFPKTVSLEAITAGRRTEHAVVPSSEQLTKRPAEPVMRSNPLAAADPSNWSTWFNSGPGSDGGGSHSTGSATSGGELCSPQAYPPEWVWWAAPPETEADRPAQLLAVHPGREAEVDLLHQRTQSTAAPESPFGAAAVLAQGLEGPNLESLLFSLPSSPASGTWREPSREDSILGKGPSEDSANALQANKPGAYLIIADAGPPLNDTEGTLDCGDSPVLVAGGHEDQDALSEAGHFLAELMPATGRKHSPPARISTTPFVAGLERTAASPMTSPSSTADEASGRTPNQHAVLESLEAEEDLPPATPEAWSEIWDSTPERDSPPPTKHTVKRPAQFRRTGQKSRFYKESAGPHLPVRFAEPIRAFEGRTLSVPRPVKVSAGKLNLKNAQSDTERQGQDSLAAWPAEGGQSGAGSSHETPGVDLGSHLHSLQSSITPQFGPQAAEAVSRQAQAGSHSSAGVASADKQPNVYAMMMAHLLRGKYDTPEGRAAADNDKHAEPPRAAAIPGQQLQFGTPVPNPSKETHSRVLPSPIAFPPHAETPQESSGSNPRTPGSGTTLSLSLHPDNPCSSSTEWSSVMFDSDEEDSPLGARNLDSSCSFTPTDSSASSSKDGADTAATDAESIRSSSVSASASKGLAGTDSGAMDSNVCQPGFNRDWQGGYADDRAVQPETCSQAVSSRHISGAREQQEGMRLLPSVVSAEQGATQPALEAYESGGIKLPAGAEEAEGVSSKFLVHTAKVGLEGRGAEEPADRAKTPVREDSAAPSCEPQGEEKETGTAEGGGGAADGEEFVLSMPSQSPATSSVQQRLWKAAAEAAERGSASKGAGKERPAELAADYMQRLETAVQQGAALEDENEALRQRLADLTAQMADLQGGRVAEDGPEEPEAHPSVTAAECLLELSDHANLVLAAYGADKAVLEEELAAARERCRSAEEATTAGLQDVQVSRDELNELRAQLQASRVAFEDAQNACKLAESARQHAQAEADRLKGELVTAQERLQESPHPKSVSQQQTPKVKRMIAQLEEAAQAGASKAPEANRGVFKELEVAALSQRICQRENAALHEEMRAAQSKLQSLQTMPASKQQSDQPGTAQSAQRSGTDCTHAANSSEPPATPATAVLEHLRSPKSTPKALSGTLPRRRPGRPPSSLRFFGHQRVLSAASSLLTPGRRSPVVLTSIPSTPVACDLQLPGKSKPDAAPESPMSTPAARSRVGGSPLRSPSQYLTPFAGEQAPGSPIWVSPVPLERWNLITERLKVLRMELKEAQSKLQAHSSRPTAAAPNPIGLQLLLPENAPAEIAAGPKLSPLLASNSGCRAEAGGARQRKGVNHSSQSVKPTAAVRMDVESTSKSRVEEENSPQPLPSSRQTPRRWAASKVKKTAGKARSSEDETEFLRKAAALGIRLPSFYRRQGIR